MALLIIIPLESTKAKKRFNDSQKVPVTNQETHDSEVEDKRSVEKPKQSAQVNCQEIILGYRLSPFVYHCTVKCQHCY
jgi:hypothetical protein